MLDERWFGLHGSSQRHRQIRDHAGSAVSAVLGRTSLVNRIRLKQAVKCLCERHDVVTSTFTNMGWRNGACPLCCKLCKAHLPPSSFVCVRSVMQPTRRNLLHILFHTAAVGRVKNIASSPDRNIPKYASRFCLVKLYSTSFFPHHLQGTKVRVLFKDLGNAEL